MGRSALFFERLSDGSILCSLCPHKCKIYPGRLGVCKTRRNDNGVLTVTTHGKLSAAAVDPIEKKPLFHFRPGSLTFSIAAAGCNLVCPFCQNHSLSQRLRHDDNVTNEKIWTAKEIVKTAQANNCESISFTYSEPVLSIELAQETAAIARQNGLDIVFVTNGQISSKGAQLLAGFLAAANVDLKCFSAKSYREVLGGDFEVTCQTIKKLHREGVWVEVTTLVIPGFNDSDKELTQIAEFIAGVDASIPWHISRFHPAYKWMDRPPTDVAVLERALKIGTLAGLHHVYTGNIHGDIKKNTRCVRCGKVLIERLGYRTGEIQTKGGHCLFCGEQIAGVEFP